MELDPTPHRTSIIGSDPMNALTYCIPNLHGSWRVVTGRPWALRNGRLDFSRHNLALASSILAAEQENFVCPPHTANPTPVFTESSSDNISSSTQKRLAESFPLRMFFSCMRI